jgi:protein-disulfide isomerase
MASRKEQKEAARQRRLEQEQAAAAQAARTRRLQIGGGVAAIVVIVVVVAIAISSSGGGGSKTTGLLPKTKATSQIAQVNTLLTGIPQSGATLGKASAPVTMTYYGDLECPICQEFTLQGGFPQIVQNEVRSGKVKIVYKAFETATQDPSVFKTQQVAALAAGKQNLFWNYTELFYRQQGAEDSGYVTEPFLKGLATQISGLNITQWQSARSDAGLAAQVSSDGAAGQAANVTGTPTVIFSGPKGSAQVPSGVPSYSDLQSAYKQVV